ncbi:MAG: hypothetical protein K2P93_00280 [Alphaproteobacteria bacterium]|nr:hypothetical protein [Alphaproteobacteria bacterium]
MNEDFLTTRELAERWNIRADTLKKWRVRGTGPLYHTTGRRINYGLEEIEEFEKNKLRSHTSMPEPPPTYLDKIENPIKDRKLSQRGFSKKAKSKKNRSHK